MRTIKLLSLLLLSISSYAQTIRRVNNDPAVPATGNVYRTLQAAHNAAAAGDIIYVEPSYQEVSYGDVTVTKTLKIIGNGYNLAENMSLIPTPADKRASLVGHVNLSTGANIKIEGLTIGQLTVQTPNAEIARCKIDAGTNVIRNVSGKNASGSIFNQNLFRGYVTLTGYSQGSTGYFLENIKFHNNILSYFYIGSMSIGSFQYPQARNIEFINNFMDFAVPNCQACKIHSNIFIRNVWESGNTYETVASHNLCLGDGPCNLGENNIQAISESDVFASHIYSTDARFVLLLDSPARGTGLNGVDIGPFGGPNPYRLSGVPAVPIITEYSRNASSGIYTNSTPMTINLSIKANN